MKLITILAHCFVWKFTHRNLTTLLFSFLLIFTPLAHSERYYLCGPDEDGCYKEIYQYCACIPVNEEESHKPFCFNFDKLSCTPLSQTPHCDPALTFKNQASCLSMIFQSIPSPACRIHTKVFCLKHNTPICNKDGEPQSCQRESG
ncbi:hypothetical protein Lnau_1732 [Legionella nautarum]|uniref:Uncharacterized protein n=1 Tax=Legionella nautarum TaxID=45070 RepID=A0A0W0WWR2_9GAMM|nr:hypothetical protein [Legionella nautarum]KTD36748.1 hypothetical protein Lnau_1732 [Legionella nautarum]